MSNAQGSAEDQAAEAQLKQLFDLIFGPDAVSLPPSLEPSPQEKAAGQATIPIEIATVTTSFPRIHPTFTRPTVIPTPSALPSVPVPSPSSRSLSVASSGTPSASVPPSHSSSPSTDAARPSDNNPLNNANASAASAASASSSRSSASSAALASGSVAALSGNGSGASSQPNAGVIAGAVIASLVALLVIISLAMFLIGRRKKQKEMRATSIDDFMSGGAKVSDLEDPTRGLPEISYHQQQYSAEPLAMADEKWRDDHTRGAWDNGQEHYHTYGNQPYTAGYLQPSANQQTPTWRPDSRHQDDYNEASRRVADSLYSESVLDYYGGDGVSRANTMRSQTGVSRANTMRSLPETIYEGLAYEQDVPPVPPMPRRTNTTRTVESRYSDDEEDYNDVHITPQHSPVFDPANTAPLNVRRTNDKSLKDLIKARVGGGRDDDAVEAGNTPSHSRKPSNASESSEGSKGYGWVPNFLRRADGNK